MRTARRATTAVSTRVAKIDICAERFAMVLMAWSISGERVCDCGGSDVESTATVVTVAQDDMQTRVSWVSRLLVWARCILSGSDESARPMAEFECLLSSSSFPCWAGHLVWNSMSEEEVKTTCCPVEFMVQRYGFEGLAA